MHGIGDAAGRPPDGQYRGG